MSKILAETAKALLREISTERAVLLRGSKSILDGELQNDIDIFIPKCEWDDFMSKASERILRIDRSAPQQSKLFFKDERSEALIEVDVFHRITWRGLEIVNIQSLPQQEIEALGVISLSKEAEVWLTVVKNVLHGSVTPPKKLQGFSEPQYFKARGSARGGLVTLLSRQLSVVAWEAASAQKFNKTLVFRARLALVTLAVIENPLKAVWGHSCWLYSRILARSRAK